MKQLIIGFTKLTAASVLVASLVACGGADDRKVKYLEKGKAYLADKNYEKARIEIKNVLQIDPKFAEAYYIMGQLEEKKKELSKSLSNYKKAIELDPGHIKAKVSLAKIYVIAGTDDFINKAKQLLEEVKKVQPVYSEADLILATIEYKTGSKDRAIKSLEEIVKNDTKLVDGVSLLSTVYLAAGEENKAIEVLADGVSNNPNNISLRLSLAKLLAKNNDLSGAEIHLKKMISIEPETFPLQVALASFYATSNQVDKAEAVLRKSIDQDDEDAQRYLVLVEMLASKVGVKEAGDELEQAIKNQPDLFELKFSQVKFYNKTGEREKAKTVLKQIINDKAYDIEGVRARLELANMLLDEGDKQGAKTYVTEVISEYPNNNDALFITSKLAMYDMDAISAINGLRTVVKNDPKNADASLLLAQAHELNKESALAENELKKSIENNPTNDQVHANYARYLASKGRIEEAVNVIDKALTYFKDSYSLMDIKLKIIASQGKESEIIALLNMMEQANPSSADVNIARGHYFVSKREVTKAIEQFEIANQKTNDKYKTLKLIVNTYLSNNQAMKAMERLQVRLGKSPDDAIANYLAALVDLSQNKVVDARVKLNLASKSAEKWYLPYKLLASTYIADNNLEKAIEIYRDAISKVSNVVEVQMQLAAIYEKQKNFTKAMDAYQKILDVNPGDKLAANNYSSLILDYGNKADYPKALELLKGFDKLPQPALQDSLAWAYAKNDNNAKAVEILKPVVEKSPSVAIFRYHMGYALYHMGDLAAAKSHLKIAVSSEQNFSGKDQAAELMKSIK